MLGLADSFMNASRFRADQEARMRDAEMRQRQMAMQEASHRMQMEEGGLRLGQMRRQDQALQDYGAEDTPAMGLPQPGAAPDPLAAQPGRAQFLEANGVEAPPAPAAGLAAPKSRYAKELKLARATGDMKTVLALQDREKAEGTAEGRKAEMQRLLKMKPEELEAMWSTVNRDGSGVNMMLTFDPKSRKYMLVSKEEGVPSRLFSQAELATDMMAFWEAGNGDTIKGMEAMMANVKRRREAADKDFDRGAGVARANADAYFKGRAADNDDARTAEQGRSNRAREGVASATLGLQRDRAGQEDWAIVGASEDNKGLLRFNRRTGQTMVQPLPPGTDAAGLFRRVTGDRGPQAGGMSEKELTDAALRLMEQDSKLSFQGAKAMLSGSYDPMAAFKQALSGGGGGAPADGQPSIQAPTPGNRILGASERPDVTRRGMAVQTIPDPSRLVRTAKRGLLGGVEYVYQDPATGKTYTVDQYNQALGGQ